MTPIHKKKLLFRKTLAFSLVTITLFSVGCGGWRGVRKVEMEPIPQEFTFALSDGMALDEAWWLGFNDETLNDLMDRMFEENLGIKQAIARLNQAKASYKMSRGSWMPSLTGHGSNTDQVVLGDPTPNPMGIDFSPVRYNHSVSANYEVDLFGRIKAMTSASYANYQASEEDLRALALSFSSQLAQTYFGVIQLQLQRDLLLESVASYRDNHEIISERYNRGVAPSYDLYQSESNLEGAKAQLALIQSNLIITKNALSLLLGAYPGEDLVPSDAKLPDNIDDLKPDLPSEVVKQRPDVRSAYNRMASADMSSAQAVADLLPKFSFTASLASSVDVLGESLNPENIIWTAIGNLTQPIFQGGRLKANSDRAEAVWEMQKAAYKQTVITAFKEVDDALAKRKYQGEASISYKRQAHAAEATLRLARDRYLQGLSDYLPVVLAQAGYLGARRGEISSHGDLVNAKIALAVAIGGGWSDDLLQDIQFSKSKVEADNE
jgi:outer membrane protein, multidrug efflux system